MKVMGNKEPLGSFHLRQELRLKAPGGGCSVICTPRFQLPVFVFCFIILNLKGMNHKTQMSLVDNRAMSNTDAQTQRSHNSELENAQKTNKQTNKRAESRKGRGLAPQSFPVRNPHYFLSILWVALSKTV